MIEFTLNTLAYANGILDSSYLQVPPLALP
jgi:hypothetical protein